MVGGYDEILQPKVVDERFDYDMFADEKKIDCIGVWQVRTFDYRNEDKTRESRYPKMHPEELLPEYEASLYIDANLNIADREIYDTVVSYCEQGVDWAGYKTPLDDCIYGHAYWVMSMQLDREKTVFELCKMLRKEGYPRNNGLHENAIIYRRNNDICRQVDEMWWDLYVRYSRRDQLSLDYVLWKYPDIEERSILPQGERYCSTKLVICTSHTSKAYGTNRRAVCQDTFFQLLRAKIRSSIPEKRERFEDFHFWLYGLPPFVARVLLFTWGMAYAPKCLYRYLQRRRERSLSS